MCSRSRPRGSRSQVAKSTPAGRWIRQAAEPRRPRRTSVRRMTLAVLGSKPAPAANPRRRARFEQEVDTIDLARPRGYRPVASGRSPLLAAGRAAWAVPEEALVEPIAPRPAAGLDHAVRGRGGEPRPGRRGGAGLVGRRPEGRPSRPAPPADPDGQRRPARGAGRGADRCPARGRGARPRVVLDACASGPPILEDGPAASLLLAGLARRPRAGAGAGQSRPDAPVQLGTVTLTELDELPRRPAAARARARGHAGPWGCTSPARTPWNPASAAATPGPATRWPSADNLAQYLGYCGATAVVVPEQLADRARRRALDGQADEDALGPDRLDLLLRVLGRQGCSAWLELAFDGPGLPGLPRPGFGRGRSARGLVRRRSPRPRPTDPAYHPLHPEVREAMRRRVVEAIAARPGRAEPRPASCIRLGPGPTLLGGPDTGFDDATFERFVRETFDARDGAGRPGPRRPRTPSGSPPALQYLAGAGRMPWLTWRSRGDGLAVRRAAPRRPQGRAGRGAGRGDARPGRRPGRHRGAAGRPGRPGPQPGLAERGAGPRSLAERPRRPRSSSAAWASRPTPWPTTWPPAPISTRWSPAGPAAGLLLGVAEEVATANRAGQPHSPTSPAPIATGNGNADANLPGIPGSAVGLAAGRRARRRRAAGPCPGGPRCPLGLPGAAGRRRPRGAAPAVRPGLPRLPAWPAGRVGPAADRQPFGVAVRTIAAAATQTYLAIANDSPYPIRLACLLNAPADAPVEDLGRGIRLAPDGRARRPQPGPRPAPLRRLGDPDRRAAGPGRRGDALSLRGRPDQHAGALRELSAQLSRLNRSPARRPAEPPQSGVRGRPSRARAVRLTRAPPPGPARAASAVPRAAGRSRAMPARHRPRSTRRELALGAGQLAAHAPAAAGLGRQRPVRAGRADPA